MPSPSEDVTYISVPVTPAIKEWFRQYSRVQKKRTMGAELSRMLEELHQRECAPSKP